MMAMRWKVEEMPISMPKFWKLVSDLFAFAYSICCYTP